MPTDHDAIRARIDLCLNLSPKASTIEVVQDAIQLLDEAATLRLEVERLTTLSETIASAHDGIETAVIWQNGEITRLREALKLPLLFHLGHWGANSKLEWKRITGHDEATTKIMCDAIRAALHTEGGGDE